MTRSAAVRATGGALLAFCLVASATYLLNDVRDRHADRRHPRKRRRPVAAGHLSPSTAVRAAVVLAFAGGAVALLVRPALALVVLGYCALTSGYSLWWRNVVILDLVAVAGGFVLRAVAGGVAADVPLSASFLIVTSACALFLIGGKRHAEAVTSLGRGAARPTLRRYSASGLRRLLIATALLACIAYARWSLSRPEIAPWLALSLIPFALWLGRYANRLARGLGEAPEELVLHDPALLALAAVWLSLFIVGLYAAG